MYTVYHLLFTICNWQYTLLVTSITYSSYQKDSKWLTKLSAKEMSWKVIWNCVSMIDTYFWAYLNLYYTANSYNLETKLNGFVIFMDVLIEISSAVTIFIREHKQKHLYIKELCHLTKVVIKNKPLIFVHTLFSLID